MKLIAIAFALWTASWVVVGDGLVPVRAGLYLAPLLLLLAALLATAALALRRWGVAAMILPGVALLALAQHETLLRPAAGAAGRPGQITLTTLSNRTLNRDMAATAELLRRHPADIFVLQEIADPAGLLARLRGLYSPEQAPSHCRLGPYMIVSRFPVGSADRASNNTVLLCPLDLPGGRAMVGAVHLPRGLWTPGAQDRAMAEIFEHAAMPLVLAGDFNATPLTRPIREAGRRLISAFDTVGRGTGFTFPTPARRLGFFGPFLRIDHVFLPPGLVPLVAQVDDWHPPMADHYPLTVRFAYRRIGG